MDSMNPRGRREVQALHNLIREHVRQEHGSFGIDMQATIGGIVRDGQSIQSIVDNPWQLLSEKR